MSRFRRRALLTLVSIVLLGFAAVPDPSPPLVVTTTADTVDADLSDGLCRDANDQCSLRAALETANASPGLDTIHFAIPDGDVGVDLDTAMATIVVDSPLPAIIEPVDVRGATDPRFDSAGGRPVVTIEAAAGAAADPLLAIRASATTISDLALVGGRPGVLVNADSVVIQRSAVGAASDAGIQLLVAEGATIVGNWIGVDWSGRTTANNGTGITVDKFAANSLIEGNVIGANTDSGIGFEVNARAGNTMIGNVISGNGGLAIDLRRDGVTDNDKFDLDPGPNDLLNFPVITQA
ncbi:MAG: right-handed parallel beta-helix repeat-containing protein, partial [Acidimicrobiia bacterium]|nr:right-handed parallel beta-helix repeat-containing protein [Acidimicrobiia bacterium]